MRVMRLAQAMVIALVTALVSLASGPAVAGEAVGWSVAPNPALANSRNAVYYVGDSITVEMFHAGQLAERTAGARLRLSGRLARVGLPSTYAAPYIVGRAKDFPYLTVIAVGTVDCYLGVAPAEYEANMTRIVKALGPRRHIAFINSFCRNSRFDGRLRERLINGALNRIAARYPNVSVHDWAGYVLAHPGLIDPRDKTHTHCTPAGTAKRGDIYLSIGRRYAAALRPVTP